jgi:hypothetical protein
VDRCSSEALALYLFLVTVGDAQGLSFYSDATLCGRLSMDASALRCAKRVLISEELIAEETPLIQVLDLYPMLPTRRANGAALIGDILKGGAR